MAQPTATTSPHNRPTFAPWPVFEHDEVDAAASVLRSGKVNYWSGDEGASFEREFADYIGTKHAIAASNGTTAIELALFGLKLQCGEEVIVPSRTFVATAAAVYQRGGIPVCADIDRDSGNITAETIAEQITDKTRGIVVVHMAGWPVDMDPIIDLAQEHGLFIVEDSAQAHGAVYKGRMVGTLGDAAAFSFCQDKILTTAGEGGIMVTDRTDVFEKAWRLKDHGRHPSVYFDRGNVKPGVTFKWIVDEFGTNMRLSEVQAAVGRRALTKLPSWIDMRRRHAHAIAAACTEAGLRTPLPNDDYRHTFYRLYSYVEPRSLASGWSRDRILQEVRDHGVPCFSGTCCEIYREAAFPSEWKPSQPLPVAAELSETSIAWLVHPTLSDEAIAYTCQVIRDVMSKAQGRQARRAA